MGASIHRCALARHDERSILMIGRKTHSGIHIMNIDSEARGIASEAMVEQALETIKNKSKKGLKSRIVSFIHARRHSALDRRHIDFIVKLETGDEIPLQVKSSERGRRRFVRKNTGHRCFIPALAVKTGEALASIINKVIGCITLAFNKLKREAEKIIHYNRVRSQRKKTWCVRTHPALMCH